VHERTWEFEEKEEKGDSRGCGDGKKLLGDPPTKQLQFLRGKKRQETLRLGKKRGCLF